MLAEDMSSQLRRRAEVSLCRHTGAVKFYESCGPGLVELPPPSDGPAVKDYLLKVTVVEAKNLPRTLA